SDQPPPRRAPPYEHWLALLRSRLARGRSERSESERLPPQGRSQLPATCWGETGYDGGFRGPYQPPVPLRIDGSTTLRRTSKIARFVPAHGTRRRCCRASSAQPESASARRYSCHAPRASSTSPSCSRASARLNSASASAGSGLTARSATASALTRS